MKTLLVSLLFATVSGLVAQPSLIISPSSLVFNVQVGDAGAIPQTIDVNSTGAPITFVVSTTSQGGNWLSVAAGTPVLPFGSWQATTPVSVAVFVTPTQLTRAGAYTGTVNIASAGATNSPRSVPVTINVGSPSSLIVSPSALSFSATVGTLSLPVQVVNISLVPPNFSLPRPTAAVLTGNSWLSIGDATSGSFPVSVKPTGLTAGTYSGSIVVSVVGASNSPLALPVTLTLTALPSSLVVSPPTLSFSATVGTLSLPAQAINIAVVPPNSSLPLPDVSVIGAGSNWLSVRNAGSGLFTVSVTPAGLAAGTYSGLIGVSLVGTSNSPVAIPVTLTVMGVIVSGVLNAASYAKDTNGQGSPVAPGSLIQIYATLPEANSANSTTVPFPDSLGSVSVTFNSISAPLSSVVPTGTFPFVNAQVPFEVLTSGKTSATVNVVVTVNGVSSAPQPVPIVSAAPGVFTVPSTGQANAVLVYLDPADGNAKIAAPASQSALFSIPAAPIPRGTSGFFYATGLGVLTPAIADGDAPSLADPHSAVHYATTPTILIGGISAEVDFAGQAPGYPGVNQVNIVIPNGAPTGNAVPLQILTADRTILSTPGATIAIR